MKLSLNSNDLTLYVVAQINNIFPDKYPVREAILHKAMEHALERVEHCFKYIKIPSYSNGSDIVFSHLHSDQYLTFLWFLSNSVWVETGSVELATKIYYLNKVLHSFDCYYDNGLPEVFFVAHGIGTVLGKAKYGNFLYVSKGCTVGANRGRYPSLGVGVGLGAGSSIIGDCYLGEFSSVGAGTLVFEHSIASRSFVYRNEEGKIEVRSTPSSLSSMVFDIPTELNICIDDHNTITR